MEIVSPIKNTPTVTTIEKVNETYRIVDEIFNDLDEVTLNQTFGGTDKDMDMLVETVIEEAYRVLYGDQRGLVQEHNLHYLDKLSTSMEESLRVESLNYFITSLLPGFQMNWHHLEWGQFASLYNKINVIAARDHGKSFFWSNAYPVWKIYRYQGANTVNRFPRRDLELSKYGFLITNEMDLAQDLLEIMKGTIEESPILKEKLYPGSKEGWGQRRIKCKNGARFQVKSYGGSFRGRHPGYIIVDDFLKDNVMYSSDQRKKSIEYFHSVIMNALLKDGQIPVVGTPFHAADLYGDLKQKKNWRVFEYPAIFPDGQILWRNRFDFYDLMEKKESQGNLIFSRENLVRPIVSDSSIFPMKILERSYQGMAEAKLVHNRQSYFKKFKRVVTGCDFAMSSSVGADFSVFSTWGIDDAENMYLMHLWRKQGASYAEQKTVLKSIYLNFKPDVMYLENNQFQQIFVEEADKEGLPVFPHTTGTNKHDLRKGLPGVAILFEKGKVRLPRGDQYSRNMTDIVTSEFASVAWTDNGLESVGEHDDCPMSVWQSVCAARHLQYGFGVDMI